MAATFCAAGLISARAQDTKKAEKSEIPGGIVGKITKVDTEKETVSIETEDGKARTFTVTEETNILGPRGGRVRRRLHNPRFHEGMEITVVATGTTAKELHLGYNRKASGEPAVVPEAATKKRLTRRQREEATEAVVKATKKAPSTVAAADDDDEDEYPGKVKSYSSNGGRHQLVVSLLNGKNGSYFLSKDVKVFVKGKESKDGLEDAALKVGTPITVFTESGGSKVKELHLEPAAAAASKAASKLKKAG